MIRHQKNPLVTPMDVKPTSPEYKVECVFNAGVVKHKDEYIMLLRVAESVITTDMSLVVVPLLEEVDGQWTLTHKTFSYDDNEYDFTDTRMVVSKSDPSEKYLTSLSHLRLARSHNGVDFDIEEQPFLFPETKYEAFGCEDPRITPVEGKYYINYSAVSSLGITTALAVTDDFVSVERKAIIFCPDNRDVCFFPEKVDGQYVAIHRPAPKHLGRPEIWLSTSPDMIHWGRHHHLLGASSDEWDKLKLGGGAPMLKTNKGWLQIYHGVDLSQRYCLGAMLLDIDDPRTVLAKSDVPLLEPAAPYELEGFFGNVVFTCGALISDDTLKVYYGAADEVMALAEISLEKLWQHLKV
ncbi:glycosidase [Photobacterium gaetbulicola]|nr:glycosidase [Photobacterium gaetbulicola]